MALPREDRFGGELHALDRQLLVPHAHDLSIFAFARDLKTTRQARALDGQGMIARDRQRALQPRKHTEAAMRYLGQLAVHNSPRAHDATAERLANRLVAKTYAEDRDRAGEAFDQRNANACLSRRAGARRNDDF